MTQKKSVLVAIAALLFAGPLEAHADVLAGPSLNPPLGVSTWTYTGIGFTATTDALLNSFVFQNNGYADVVSLYDSTGNVLQSISIAANDKSFASGTLNWSLTAGAQYYLLDDYTAVGGIGNATFALGGISPISDNEITLTQSGIFANAPLFSSDSPPQINLSSASGLAYWAAFNNITTTPVSPVPEPPAYAMLLAGLALLVWQARRSNAGNVT